MPQDPSELKSMPLYRDVDRVYKELIAAGLDDHEELCVADLAAFDQYHYHGTNAVDYAIQLLDIASTDRILEIGSGIGGPSRYIAAKTGARIVALELQPELDETAGDLTERCGLSDRVRHVCADVLEYSSTDHQFDVIVSWLAFFHIEQRELLLSRCHGWLKQSGRIFVEDLYARGKFTPKEQRDLEIMLFSRYLPDREAYEHDFRVAGFSDLQIDDMSDDWQRFTRDRHIAYCRDRERHEKIHDKPVVEGLESFYAAVNRLFSRGSLGGIRLVGHK
jgi:cyclopropane fatty-acyl-phospholipid synthase-like methyltransferase